MKTFIAGGGLGDCVLILNKLRQLATPQDRLIYYLAEKQSHTRDVIHEFWESQGIHPEIRMVSEIATPLNHHEAGVAVLNPLIYGTGCIMVERWKFVYYPFDAFATPTLRFDCNPSPYHHYFVVQSDAGTMKYRGHKNWLNTGWIEDFISVGRASGLKCVVVGANDIGIRGADYYHYNVPLKDLFGLLESAEFVLGLQGFVTLVALSMRRRVLLKRENFRVILNYFHPRWREHAKIFSEPKVWPNAKTEALFNRISTI
ncbi:MAG: hypothetical protein MUF81_00275 [Verrucomicrobia bacterium]|jgi:hypothetical protein|nr:hypothetical protein [Verrucomicrobiota bacterium]